MKANRVSNMESGVGSTPPIRLEQRKCAKPGCPTILSRYNTRGTCYAHQEFKIPRNRGKVEKPDAPPRPVQKQQQSSYERELCPGSWGRPDPFTNRCPACGDSVAINVGGKLRRHARLVKRP